MILSLEYWQGPLAQTLLHFLWQGAAIAGFVTLLLALLREHGPECRYRVGLCGLLLMAVAPLVTLSLLLPEREIPVTAPVPHTEAAPHQEHTAPAQIATRPPLSLASQGSVSAAHDTEEYYPWIIAVWCIGVFFLGLRLICGYLGLYRLSWPRMPITPELAASVQRLAKLLNMRVPRIYLNARVPEAFVTGIISPLILVPAAWLTELPLPMLEAVLAHELAHVRRYDLWFSFLQRLVETLLFYHPCMWWLSARVRQERELCCDALAVSATADRVTYAQTLERVARLASGIPHAGWAVAMGGGQMNLLARVQRVLGVTPEPKNNRPWLAGLVSVSGSFSGKHLDSDAWSSSLAGTYTLLIDAAGFNPVFTKEFEFNKRMEPLVVDLQPAVYVLVRGRLVDKDGRPLADARVRSGRVFVTESTEFPWGVETTTDGDGRFELKQLRLGERIFVYAEKKGVGGVQSARFTLDKDQAYDLGDLKVPTGNLSIAGKVQDNDGQAVPAATVHALDGIGESTKVSTKTDADGKFHFDGLLPGKVWLQTEAKGFDRSWQPVEAMAGDKDVEILLNRIPDPNKIVPTLSVKLRPKDGGQVSHTDYWWVHVGEGERFSSSWNGNETKITDDVKAGATYALVMAPKGYAWPKPVLIKAEKFTEPVTVDLEAAAPVALQGRVVDDKRQPMGGVQVGLARTLFGKFVDRPWSYSDEGRPPLSTLTDADGRFRIPDLLPGCEVAVYVNKPGYAGAESPRTVLAAGRNTTLADIRLSVSQRMVTGIIVDKQNQPVAQAKVKVQGFGAVTTTSGADGKFEITGVPHGQISIVIDAEDYSEEYATVKEDEREIRVTLGYKR